jgi:hypothetical protein
MNPRIVAPYRETVAPPREEVLLNLLRELPSDCWLFSESLHTANGCSTVVTVDSLQHEVKIKRGSIWFRGLKINVPEEEVFRLFEEILQKAKDKETQDLVDVLTSKVRQSKKKTLRQRVCSKEVKDRIITFLIGAATGAITFF